MTLEVECTRISIHAAATVRWCTARARLLQSRKCKETYSRYITPKSPGRPCATFQPRQPHCAAPCDVLVAFLYTLPHLTSAHTAHCRLRYRHVIIDDDDDIQQLINQYGELMFENSLTQFYRCHLIYLLFFYVFSERASRRNKRQDNSSVIFRQSGRCARQKDARGRIKESDREVQVQRQ